MKKAQIRMSETIAVLFIFFVLIVFGLIFYYKYSQISFKEKQEELLASKAMDLTLKTVFLPELICSRGEAEPEDNCFDLIKLHQAALVFEEHFSDYYFSLFPFANLTVTQLYPEPEAGQEKWTLYFQEKPNWTRKEATYFVVTLRDETDEKSPYRFGFLTVEVYS